MTIFEQVLKIEAQKAEAIRQEYNLVGAEGELEGRGYAASGFINGQPLSIMTSGNTVFVNGQHHNVFQAGSTTYIDGQSYSISGF